MNTWNSSASVSLLNCLSFFSIAIRRPSFAVISALRAASWDENHELLLIIFREQYIYQCNTANKNVCFLTQIFIWNSVTVVVGQLQPSFVSKLSFVRSQYTNYMKKISAHYTSFNFQTKTIGMKYLALSFSEINFLVFLWDSHLKRRIPEIKTWIWSKTGS